MSETVAEVPRPPLGRLVFSTGEVAPLEGVILMGRRPRFTAQADKPHPHVVVLPSPRMEISKTHCEVRVENWDVQLIDMGSANGTFVHRPGTQPMRLTARMPFSLRPGDKITFGEGVTAIVEV